MRRRKRRLRRQLRRTLGRVVEVVEAVGAIDAEVLQSLRLELDSRSGGGLVHFVVKLHGERLQDFGAVFVILEQRFGKVTELKISSKISNWEEALIAFCQDYPTRGGTPLLPSILQSPLHKF